QSRRALRQDLKPTASSRIEPVPCAVQSARRAKDRNQPVSCIT
ncbi:hypothetical protein A2U01_0096532, partial [Trifolium medium]|nr:hypothetical protein [Trifolium medium]